MSDPRRANRRLLWQLLAMAAGSFGFGFALVPLVQRAVLGHRLRRSVQAPRAVQAVEHPDVNRTVKVEFLADVASAGNWEFRPVVRTLDVHPGQLYTAQFYAHNLSGRDSGRAGGWPNIAPSEVATYFHKTECFCFSPTALRAQTRGANMPVRFFIDPGAAAPHRSHHTGVHLLRRILARQLTTVGTRDSRQESSWPTHTLPTAATTTFRINSPWPIRGSIALFAIMLGAIGYLNDWTGAWSFLPGAVLLAYMFFGWFATVIDENQHGIYNLQVDRSFRMGMMWFHLLPRFDVLRRLLRRALFYARLLSVPWLGGEGVKVFSNFILWPPVRGRLPDQRPGARRRPAPIYLRHHSGDRRTRA